MPATSKETDRAAIILGTISLLGSIITAYFGFRASSRPVETIISATQTAEAKALISVSPQPIILITPLPTTTFAVDNNAPQIVTATNIPPQRQLPDNVIYVGQSFTPVIDARSVILRVEYVQITDNRLVVYFVLDGSNIRSNDSWPVHWCGSPTLKKAGYDFLESYTDKGGLLSEMESCPLLGGGYKFIYADIVYDSWISYKIDPTSFDVYGLYELSGFAGFDPVVFEVLP